MNIQLRTHEKMLLALLRASLNNVSPEETIFNSANQTDWTACYKLAVEQGVMALAWDGISMIPENCKPPKGLKIKWALAVEAYEQRYTHYCKTAIELANLFAAHGIKTLFLKGVGFSTLYPEPSHREGGDIDIYTYSADKLIMSDEEASRRADELIKQMNIEVSYDFYKHSSFTYKGIMIENHKCFLTIHDFQFASDIEPLLENDIRPTPVEVLKGKDKILTPPDTFNLLFIASHAIQHYSRGLCLHHLCDWACILNRCGLHIPQEITNQRFVDVLHSLTGFTNLYLGTQIKTTYKEADIERLYIEIMRSPYEEHYPTSNPLAIFIYRIKRLIKYRRAMNQFIGEPIFLGCLNVLKRRIREPKTMFRKEKNY